MVLPHLDFGWYTFSLVVVFYVSNPLVYRTAHVSNSYKFNSFEVFIDVNFGISLPSLVNVDQNTKIALQQTTYRAQLTNPMLTSPGMHYTSPSVNWSHLSLVALSLLSLFKLEVFLLFSDPTTRKLPNPPPRLALRFEMWGATGALLPGLQMVFFLLTYFQP